jgi:hypothetical protein
METAHQLRPVYHFHDLQIPREFAQNMKIILETGEVAFYPTRNFDENSMYQTFIPLDKIEAAQQAFRMEEDFHLN